MSAPQPSFGPPQYQPYYPPPQQAKSNGAMIAVSIIAVLLAVALVGFLAYYFGSSRSNPVNSAQSVNTVQAQQTENAERPTVTQTVNAPAPDAPQQQPAPSKRTYTEWSVNDANVTTSPFAANVFSQFVSAYNRTGDPNLTLSDVYSPTTGKYYTMTCRDQGSRVACTGGRNAAVYIK